MMSNLVWCGICAKYLAFDTYLTSAVGALNGGGGECSKKLVVGEVKFNAAAVARNGQVTDVSEFREVIVCRK